MIRLAVGLHQWILQHGIDDSPSFSTEVNMVMQLLLYTCICLHAAMLMLRHNFIITFISTLYFHFSQKQNTSLFTVYI